MCIGDDEADRSSELLLVLPISTTATQRRLLGVHTYGAGTPITGVLAPHVQLGFGGEGEATAARVCRARMSSSHSLAPRYIDPPNGLPNQRPIRVLFLLGSHPAQV